MIGQHARSIRLAMVIAIGITLLAAPIASADDNEFLFVIPAGEACAFDVGVNAVDRNPYGNGAVLTNTNVETGATYVWFSTHAVTETYVPETNAVLFEIRGRMITSFYPGDSGPNGTVGEFGALIAVAGFQRYILDLDTNVMTGFSLEGTFVDICAELAD